MGSAGTRSYEFSKKLISNGHTVEMICASNERTVTGLNQEFVNGKREGVVESINVTELKIPYSNYDGFIKRSLSFIRFSLRGILISLRKDYDIILTSSTPLTVAIPGIIASIFRSKKFIFEVRDLWPELPRAMGIINSKILLRILGLIETLAYKRANACIALSPGIKKGIHSKSKNKNITIIPNGCDNEYFRTQVNKKKSKKINFVFTGAHGKANGLDSVLDAAKELLKSKEKNIFIKFIGDGSEKPKLIKRSIDENLTNCEFLDPMPKKELFNFLNTEADVGLMILKNIEAFYDGTSPNKFFDYLSLGLPVINNYPGWLSKLIKNNNCGIAVRPDNPKLLSNAMIKLYEDRILRIKMGKNSRKLALESYDRDYLSSKFVKFIESV